jgi:lipase maturation factor 1
MAVRSPGNFIRWLFDGRYGPADRLIPRWIFLRALAAIYFSAFYSLLFQIKGEIGPEGVLPAQQYLAAVARSMGVTRYWYAPSLYWISSSSQMLMAVTWLGIVASIAAFVNAWPRLSFFVSWVCFLSFVAASGDFSSYQSDGMLLEAGFISLFFAPRGVWPGWGEDSPPSRASLFLLQWEWFRIYFESGMVKLLSGDEEWRHLTAMDEYYQNGPLPTWVGWYAQHLPHWFHVATAAGTLVIELGAVLMLFFPRRVRLVCFVIVTLWEIPVILTANYTFLNYLVLSLGFLLLDDRTLTRFLPARWRPKAVSEVPRLEVAEEPSLSILASDGASEEASEFSLPGLRSETPTPSTKTNPHRSEQGPLAGEPERRWGPRTRGSHVEDEGERERLRWRGRIGRPARAVGLAVSAVMLSWIAYATTAEMIRLVFRETPLPTTPIVALEPFRIANQYGLFAVMTRGRYEIEFQGSNDGENWTPYPFRYKPQLLNEAPGIYAPYQPRFDWNLWFASLANWRESEIVPLTEERLLQNSKDVLELFKGNPFAKTPPRVVRAVLWQYWFTSMDEKRRTGNWWRRRLLGIYAPVITRTDDGRYAVMAWPDELGPHD